MSSHRAFAMFGGISVKKCGLTEKYLKRICIFSHKYSTKKYNVSESNGN